MYLCVGTHVFMCTCTPWYTCRDRRTTHGSWLSSTMRVSGTELKFPALEASIFHYWATLPMLGRLFLHFQSSSCPRLGVSRGMCGLACSGTLIQFWLMHSQLISPYSVKCRARTFKRIRQCMPLSVFQEKGDFSPAFHLAVDRSWWWVWVVVRCVISNLLLVVNRMSCL